MTKRLIAYRIDPQPMEIVAAPLRRDWMDDTPGRHAYRCLPLDMANQNGWMLLCPDDLVLRWDGRAAHDGVAVTGGPEGLCAGHFGHGIATFKIPYLFRTEAGYNLRIAGVPNLIRPGVQNLEGMVETDWAPQTFTVNLKITAPNQDIEIAKDEPFAMLTPVRRGETEEFSPEIRDISDDPELDAEHARFRRKRGFTYEMNAKRREKGAPGQYDLDYFHGRGLQTKSRHPDHQTRLRLKPFTDLTQTPDEE